MRGRSYSPLIGGSLPKNLGMKPNRQWEVIVQSSLQIRYKFQVDQLNHWCWTNLRASTKKQEVSSKNLFPTSLFLLNQHPPPP